MTEEELKENIIARFRCICDLGRYPAELQVADIFDWFKQADYVKLAEDQSLPNADRLQAELKKQGGYHTARTMAYAIAQQDMLKANFKRVE